VAEAQPDNTGGCMLALYPAPRAAKKLAVPDGLPPGEIHLTVAYAGNAADVDPAALRAVARKLASRPPVTASVSGHARLTGGDTDVIVALADGADLEDIRRDAMDLLSAQGITVPRDHGYTPHLTLRYAASDDPDPVGRLSARPLAFTGIAAVHGKTRTDYPFGGELAAAAREAYATGLAISGGPVTDRVIAGCEAAVAVALERPGDPRILELALDLGSLTGTWAEVYRRREELTAGHVAKVTAVWRKLAGKLRPQDLVAGYKRATGYTSEATRPDAWQREAAKAAALAWLDRILSDPRYHDLAKAITAALIAAAAEGKTAALAVAADQAAARGFDWDKAYTAMQAGLTDVEGYRGLSDSVAREIITAAASDAARVLATMTASGATDPDAAGGIADAVDGEDVQAVSVAVDTAIGKSMAQAALDLYMSEGLDLVAWLTAGDGRVCPSCQDNEDNGPYSPSAFPQCPDHPRCRCCPTPASPLPVSAFAQFLVPVA